MTTPDATATARLIFDASSIRTGVNQANQSLGTLYEVVRNNWWGIRNIGDAFSSVGGAISAGMTVAVSSAAEFESSMATVSRTTYDATQSMEANAEMASKLGDQLKQLAETNPIDLKTITGVAASAGALGIASQDVAEFTKTITQFASVTDVSADTATSSLAKIANVFNLNASQFKNLGSAVYDVGVNTAATESQILNMATRLAPFAAAAGLSAAETVGLSAAVQSLGPRAEAGASALQHLLAQLAKVATGTDPKKLQEFADVAGVSADEFSRLVAVDPGTALSKFVTGLAGVSSNAVTSQKALSDLGIVETREIATLEALAAGVKGPNDSMVNLTNTMKASSDAFTLGTALAGAAKIQYNTLSAQIQTLKNTFTVIATEIGTGFLPVMKVGVDVVRDLAIGFQALPSPLKTSITGAIAIAGALASIAAVAVLIGPRIVLAANAFGKLSAGVKTAVAAQIAANSANNESAASNLRAAVAAGANRNAIAQTAAAQAEAAAATRLRAAAATLQLQLLEQQAALEATNAALIDADSEANGANAAVLEARAAAIAANIAVTEEEIVVVAGETAAMQAATAGMGGATVAAYGLGSAMKFMLGPWGIALTAVGALVGGLAIFGSSHKAAAEATQQDATAQQDMIDAINKEVEGEKNAIDTLLVHKLAMENAGAAAAQFGFSMSDLLKIIQGLPGSRATEFVEAMNQAIANGDPDAKKLSKTVQDMTGNFYASVEAIKEQQQANKDLGTSAGQAADGENKLSDASDKAAQAADKQAQASIDLVSALLSQKGAALQVQDAEEAYQKALDAVKNKAATVATAETALSNARIAQERAVKGVSDAEKDLANARAKQQQEYQDDLRDEASANISYQNSLDKVQAAQKALNDAQGPKSVQDLLEATNKLADAQLDLVDSQKKASDAQWYLNYLMEEGASNRDIQDAQDALNRANQNVLDSTDKVTQAQDDLNEAQNESSAENLAKLERDLEQARLDSEAALEKLHDSEKQTAADRDAIAHDTAYHEALLALTSAQNDLKDANDRLHAAQKDVSSAQSGKQAAEDLRQAEFNLEQALYSQAKANVEVQKQQALANGETFTARDEAKALSEQLTKLGNNAGGPVKKNMQDLANVLKTQFKDRTVTMTVNTDTSKAIAAIDSYAQHANAAIAGIDNLSSNKPWWQRWLSTIGNFASDFFHWIGGVDIDPSQWFSGLTTPFADGGVVTGFTPFTDASGRGGVAGEAGAEAIIPLDALFNQLLAPLQDMQKDIAYQNAVIDKFSSPDAAGQVINNYYYNDIKTDVETNADPYEIGEAIAWAQLTKAS